MAKTPEDKFRSKVLEALHARKVRPIEKDILLCLWGYTRCFGGAAWPSHDTIADRVGCSVRTVERALKKLQGLGWVDWQHRYQKEGPRMVQCSNLYNLSIPADMFTVSSDRHFVRRNCKINIKRGLKKLTPSNHGDYVSNGENRSEDVEIAATNREGYGVDNTRTTLNSVDKSGESAAVTQSAREEMRLRVERRAAAVAEQWYREKDARQKALMGRREL